MKARRQSDVFRPTRSAYSYLDIEYFLGFIDFSPNKLWPLTFFGLFYINILMDAIDLKILELLSSHGRESVAEIGRQLELSGPSVHARIKQLEETGVITGYQVCVDETQLNVNVTAFIEIHTSPFKNVAEQKKFESFFVNSASVIECHDCTGSHSYFAKIHAKDLSCLRALVSTIRSLPRVTGTNTTISMQPIKYGAPTPLIYALGND